MTTRAMLVVSTVDTYQPHYYTVPMPTEEADELHAEISGAMQDMEHCPTVYVPTRNESDATIATRCVTSVVLLPLPDPAPTTTTGDPT